MSHTVKPSSNAVLPLTSTRPRPAHILEGLVKAQDRIDDVVAVGKASSSREQFESVLRGDETMAGIDPFDFSEAQAKAIAERRLYQLSRLDVSKVQDEHEELKLVIADLEDVLSSRPRRLTILKDELAELVDRHGDERRSFIDPMPLSMDREDLIEERAIVITLSEDNFVTRRLKPSVPKIVVDVG